VKRNVLINSITLNIPKNSIQFFIGIVFYITFFGLPGLSVVLFSCAAFLVTYSAVYVYNDIGDAEHDSKHSHKKVWKLVASGLLDKKQSWMLYVVLLGVGFTMSLFVNVYFFVMMLLLVGLNFLHSCPKIYLKNSLKKTAVNMTVIEFLKYSAGWFALTTNLSYFPFWVAIVLSLSYNLSYIIYKAEQTRSVLRDNKRFFISMGIAAFASYIIAFFTYQIPLVMIAMLIIPAFLLSIFKYASMEYNKLNGTLTMVFTLMIAIVLSFTIIIIPPGAEANNKIATEIDIYALSVKESIPEPLAKGFDEITYEMEKYENLEQLVEDVNESIMNLTNGQLP